METPKENTLIKRNNILRTIIKENKSLNVNSLKIYNYIYMLLQYNRENIKEDKIFFTHEKLLEQLKIKNKNYIPIIK